MKNKSLRLLALSTVFASTVLVGVSCKKDKDDNGSSAFSATLGSESFKPKVVSAAILNNYFEIDGFGPITNDSIDLNLTIPETVTVNTKLDFNTVGIQIAKFKNFTLYSSNESPSHGTITVTALDKTNKKIAGTFSGVVYQGLPSGTDSVVIKNGQFNTSYTN